MPSVCSGTQPRVGQDTENVRRSGVSGAALALHAAMLRPFTSFAIGTLAVLALASGCTVGTGPSGASTSDGGSTTAGCTKQPAKLAEANCETGRLDDLWACEPSAAAPAAECTRTTIKDSYCCPSPPPKARAVVQAELSGGAVCTGALFTLAARASHR